MHMKPLMLTTSSRYLLSNDIVYVLLYFYISINFGEVYTYFHKNKDDICTLFWCVRKERLQDDSAAIKTIDNMILLWL